MVRTPGAAPGTSGWKPDTLLLRHVRAEGRRHDHHTVAGAASLAGSAGAFTDCAASLAAYRGMLVAGAGVEPAIARL